MTDLRDARSDALRIGIAASVAVHLLALILVEGGFTEELRATRIGAEGLESFEAAAAPNGTVALESWAEPSGEAERRLAQRRREAMNAYLEAVDDAVHAHRLDAGERDLIGLCSYAFEIGADGRFRNIELRSGSGRADLDRAARRAVEAASGQVKRPAILGDSPILVVIEVRYQYGLR